MNNFSLCSNWYKSVVNDITVNLVAQLSVKNVNLVAQLSVPNS